MGRWRQHPGARENCKVSASPPSGSAVTSIFSCASAKAERSLSSLSCVWMYVDQNLGTPPGQDFMDPYQNATPLLYDSKFAHNQKDPPPQLNCHGCIW